MAGGVQKNLGVGVVPAVLMIEEATSQREEEIPTEASVEPAEEAGKKGISSASGNRGLIREPQEKDTLTVYAFYVIYDPSTYVVYAATHILCAARAAWPLHGVWVFGHGLAFLYLLP